MPSSVLLFYSSKCVCVHVWVFMVAEVRGKILDAIVQALPFVLDRVAQWPGT